MKVPGPFRFLLAAGGLLAVLPYLAAPDASAQTRDQIRLVGSSTVFPFATAVAEQFGKTTRFKTPVVESTGSGGGIKLFCAGLGDDFPDLAMSSRRITERELELCAGNGVASAVEVKIGYDGIVFANSKAAERLDLTRAQIFLALAREVPQGGRLVANPYNEWSEIDRSLPDEEIEVLGPPPTSGTRDAFAELVMEEGCDGVEGAAALGLEGKACHEIREDGRYIDAGENDNLIVRKLEANPAAYGIFGFSFLDQNRDDIQGATIGGIAPTFDAIASGDYPLSRPLYIYVKVASVRRVPGIREYLSAFLTEEASAPDGYLADRGLIPLPDDERSIYVEALADDSCWTLDDPCGIALP